MFQWGTDFLKAVWVGNFGVYCTGLWSVSVQEFLSRWVVTGGKWKPGRNIKRPARAWTMANFLGYEDVVCESF